MRAFLLVAISLICNLAHAAYVPPGKDWKAKPTLTELNSIQVWQRGDDQLHIESRDLPTAVSASDLNSEIARQKFIRQRARLLGSIGLGELNVKKYFVEYLGEGRFSLEVWGSYKSIRRKIEFFERHVYSDGGKAPRQQAEGSHMQSLTFTGPRATPAEWSKLARGFQ